MWLVGGRIHKVAGGRGCGGWWLGWAGLNLGMQLPQTPHPRPPPTHLRVRQLNQINTVGATRVSAFIRFAFNSTGENTDTRIMSVAGVRRIKRQSPPPKKTCMEKKKTSPQVRLRRRTVDEGRMGELSDPCHGRAGDDGKGQLSMKMQMSGSKKTTVPTGLGTVTPPPPPSPMNSPARLHKSLTYRQGVLLQLKACSITAKCVCCFGFFLPSSWTLSESHRQMMFDFRAWETFNGVHWAINLAGGVG